MTGTVEVPDEAVRVAASLIASEIARSRVRSDRTVLAGDLARHILAAAVPLLRAQWERELREQIAAEIEAFGEDQQELARDGYIVGYVTVPMVWRAAARIARGGVS